MVDKIIEEIFREIEEAIEKTKSPVPVTISESKLIKELKRIKEKYELKGGYKI